MMLATLQPPPPTFDDVWRGLMEIRELFKENDKQIMKTKEENDRRIEENDRILKNLSKKLGDLGNRLGEFVEHMVSPAVVRLFQNLGIEVHTVYPNIESHRNGEGIEIDLLVVNDGVLVAVECKSKLTEEHVAEHLVRMEKLKRLLPEFRNHRALGAVAAMVMSEEVKRYAHSQGLYVLYQNGETIEIGTPSNFAPKAW
ncbi:MAG: hypothetical protein Q8O31_00530 [Rhodocyclaceae bacterium]|nr:hypothetical protein [Rhodocyclaceae bacterium]